MIKLVFMSKDVDRLSEVVTKLSYTSLCNEMSINHTPGLKIVGRQKDYVDSVSHSNAVSVLSSRAVWVYELELQSIYSDEYYIDLDATTIIKDKEEGNNATTNL